MPFSLGVPELLAILAILIPTIVVLATRGYSAGRWFVAASFCLVTAAVVTPADLFSMSVMSVAFFATIMLGSRMRLLDNPVAS